MGKYIIDAALDAALAIVTACTRMDITSDSSTPTGLTNSLANVTMAPGDYTVGAGSPTGRRVTTAAKTGIAITASGTPRHTSLSLGGTIKYVTTCTGTDFVSGNNNTCSIEAFYLNLSAVS